MSADLAALLCGAAATLFAIGVALALFGAFDKEDAEDGPS